MKKLLVMLVACLTIFSCSKKDDDVDTPMDHAKQYIMDNPQGSWFIMKGTNVKDTLLGAYVTSSGGQLLDQAFYRIINVSTPKGSFNFRVSFPKSMIGEADGTWFSRHSLNTERLPLEETKYLKAAYAELDFSSSPFFSDKNVSGSVDLKNNHEYNGTTYEIFAEVYLRVEGKDKALYDIEGYFWKK